MALLGRTRTGERSTFVLIVALLMVVGVVAAAGAAAAKSDVCHYDSDMDTYHLINISDNAYDKHIAHGDAAPFDAVPTMPTYEFDAECGIYSTMVVDGEFSKSGLDIEFTAYEAFNGDISGVASYSYTGNGNVMSSTVSDVCLDSVALTATVWGPGTSTLSGDGFMIYTLVDDGTTMSTRALFRATEAAAITMFNSQCLTSLTGASGGTGFLTFG